MTATANHSLEAMGRARRLRRLAGADGIVAGIALDHRDSFRAVLERQGIAARSTADLQILKHALARAIAPAATAVMLDPEFGWPALGDEGIPSDVGLIMPLENQGYEAQGDHRLTTLLEDFAPHDALLVGADACKLLLPYRIDDEPTAARQDALVAATVAACHAAGLPLVLEPVVHRLSTESEADHAAAYAALVIGAVERLQPLGADMLKLPFPIRHPTATLPAEAIAACRSLADACGVTPWVLLGGGEATDVDELINEIRMAGEAGASGFLAGRAIWGPALRSDPAATARLAVETALPAFLRCRAMAAVSARPLPSRSA